MVLAAIDLGIKEYHITEHTPVPNSFLKMLQPNDGLRESLAMKESEVDRYLKEMLGLKKKYGQKIQVKVGFEVDYIPGFEGWTQDFLNEYGPYMDTGILSVHYMKGFDWRCCDYLAEDVIKNLLPYYPSAEAFQEAYYQLMEKAIQAGLGPYKPRRLGHLTLCNKFKDRIGFGPTQKINARIESLLRLAKEKNMGLDYNHAGLFKPDCKETYPPQEIAMSARLQGIPLIYGSDAHGVADLRRAHTYDKC